MLSPEDASLFTCVLITPVRRRNLQLAVTRKPKTIQLVAETKVVNPVAPLTNIRVLLAEDNIVNQKIAAQVLFKAGCVLDVVENGKDAIEALESKPYDVILMDCQMPVMDGFTATELIRASGELWNSTPIIAVTANAMSGDRERCLAAGMNDYLAKPIKPAKLVEVIANWTINLHNVHAA